MDITLYKCSAETNRLDKSAFLGTGLEITGAIPKGAFKVDAAELAINYNGDLSGYNYAKINVDGTEYYYYATITGDIGHQMRVSCKRDPLFSFLSQNIALPIFSARCEQAANAAGDIGFNSYFADAQQPVLVPELVQRKEIYTFNWTNNFILVTVG